MKARPIPTLALVPPDVQTAPDSQMSHLPHEVFEPVLVGPGPLDIDTFIKVEA